MAILKNALYAEVANRVRHQIQVGLEAAPRWYPRVATVIPSSTDYEEYDWLGAFPEVREWLGDMIFDQLSSAGFTIRNREWYDGVRLPKKAIDDGKTGYFNNLSSGLAEQFARHPDKLIFELMADLENVESFDGQSFFDTDHVWGDSGLQSNLLTASVANVASPTKAELIKAVTDAMINMMQLKNDRGEPFVFPTASTFNDLIITCSPTLWPIFDEAFNAAWKEENGAAVGNYTLVKPEIIPLVSYSGNRFDIYRVGQSIKPFVFQDRDPVMMFTKGADDPTARDIIVGGKARYNVGGLAWWLAARVNLV